MYSRHVGMYLRVALRLVSAMGMVRPKHVPPMYDRMKALGKLTTYKEGGSLVKFESFDEAFEKLEVLTLIQQFDSAFYKGSSIEESKIWKAMTMLKDNALQCGASIANASIQR